MTTITPTYSIVLYYKSTEECRRLVRVLSGECNNRGMKIDFVNADKIVHVHEKAYCELRDGSKILLPSCVKVFPSALVLQNGKISRMLSSAGEIIGVFSSPATAPVASEPEYEPYAIGLSNNMLNAVSADFSSDITQKVDIHSHYSWISNEEQQQHQQNNPRLNDPNYQPVTESPAKDGDAAMANLKQQRESELANLYSKQVRTEY
jgi:hypothetical protein